MFCKNCGSHLDKGVTLCESCGSVLGDGTMFCAQCGAKLRQGASRCDQCGASADFGVPRSSAKNKRNSYRRSSEPYAAGGAYNGSGASNTGNPYPGGGNVYRGGSSAGPYHTSGQNDPSANPYRTSGPYQTSGRNDPSVNPYRTSGSYQAPPQSGAYREPGQSGTYQPPRTPQGDPVPVAEVPGTSFDGEDWVPAGKSKLVAVILSVIFFGLGVHNFYLGEYKKGLLRLLTAWFGLGYLLTVVDILRMLTNSYRVDPDSWFL